MPICPRCGKTLSSDQALQYHLNKKYKCGTWKCGLCDIVFDTKFSLNIHKLSCGNKIENKQPTVIPSFDTLMMIYCDSPCIFYEYDNSNIVQKVSPQYSNYYYEPIIGSKIDVSQNSVLANNNTFKRIQFSKNMCMDILI